MRAGTDDVASAYRVVPTATPQYSVVVLWDQQTGAPEYYTMPGFNFGLASAVPQFNRVTHGIR